ncbi:MULTISPECIES: bifunctional ADP-dependent NAD(P)H-hydrate dehydratase/NAD(P)H-hydrate epimerase [Segatella]|jgi:NAD(P)H-hydrate epimerase|uniref:Bifunctional NAD(P)H-hydrate repair enzyme n=2 Tax=Segatella TaxID=2974251 RepID=D8E031_9BACT|nr:MULTISPECIES: bifunctional ADP-dependent NAD(P)H-hydrate dehydratase/NAD(P)H-hydrate epimerase [Segatella]EFI70962.1 carbohydrate kinase family protein [Segatella baroniae B14]UKK77679.1 bifunctional ADP-dependent NAD(P)H-hydrate dehydratase/NAD(P)H-hydrate epimerase [Segatella baroniae B14]GJG28054.1 bifunctional NAD(P)H-hydrate repair enzyme [Segatella bryantii]SEQ93234.1 NAD(P)H-hydrate epimerase [Segatella baroniae B14]
MKIFTGNQIHELDKYTIEHEPISSIDLMERASKAIYHAISAEYDNRISFVVFAGPGNNGGDALAVSRMLAENGYNVSVFLFNIHNHLSEECATNKQRILDGKKIKKFTEITVNFDPPTLDENTVVIDGLFGSGLNKPLSGGFASLVKYINASACKVISIDLPSGLMCEDNTYNIPTNIIKANQTFTLQQKKLAMLLADNQIFLGKIKVLDIRLSQEFIQNTDSPYQMVEENDIRSLLHHRNDFAHKGNMGNALIIAGSYGMAGASVLATKACLRAGVGKVTAVTPRRNYEIMQISVPEAVLQMDKDELYFSEPIDTEKYNAMGIGPGLGSLENTAIALIAQIRRATCPIVIDADALNILANHRAWMQQLPPGAILTPHPKEMDRLNNGINNGSYDRLRKAQELAEHFQVYIILKGHYSALCLPDGHIFFNTTGNSGMATAGSGDVLTGIITGLLAKGYKQEEACKLGMYLHGLAGDLAVKDLGKESLIASDIIKYLPQAFLRLED